MSKGSFMRQMKRKVIREGGVTFADRVRESIRTGQPVKQVVFEKVGGQVKAKAK